MVEVTYAYRNAQNGDVSVSLDNGLTIILLLQTVYEEYPIFICLDRETVDQVIDTCETMSIPYERSGEGRVLRLQCANDVYTLSLIHRLGVITEQTTFWETSKFVADLGILDQVNEYLSHDE